MLGNAIVLGAAALLAQTCAAAGPFLTQLDDTKWIIGNDHWNVTQNAQYATKLYWKGQDLVGGAVGGYVSYNGSATDLAWTNASIVERTDTTIDVAFTAPAGEFHWVIGTDLIGAYQYFVNTALPLVGEFRTVWRLDNETFPNGRTTARDGVLPTYQEILDATVVQDSTFQQADGTYLTKYDWSAFLREQDYYGIYGDEFGSWFINPGKDYYNGNHLKQELMVHRETDSGDAVQLNMIHGTHFQVGTSNTFAVGKVWGPWLWYLNDGDQADAAARAAEEFAAWPYEWYSQDSAYLDRAAKVTGSIVLSDGRVAAGAAVFLGDNNPEKTALDMDAGYYYTTYADEDGKFTFEHVRTGEYGLQAWANGSALGDVSTTLLENDVTISADETLDLGEFTWSLNDDRERIFRVGDFDRTTLGFLHGGAPYQHALIDECPADLNFTIGESADEDWCFGSSAVGDWNIGFELDKVSDRDAILTVSLAGYTRGVSANLLVNDNKVGNLTSGIIPSDGSTYRSATTAGEWNLYEFTFDGASLLKEGANTVTISVTGTTQWHGFLWDSILLDWA